MIGFINKIKGLLNIHADRNQKWILIYGGISTLLTTYTNPILTKTIITELPPEWLAFESMAISVASLLIGMAWQGKVREYAIKWFLWLTVIESTCGFLLSLYLAIVEFNVWAYAIASLIYISLISVFIGKCIMYFKARLWVEKDRELYDNNNSIVGGITCIVGYLMALLFMPPLKLAVFIWGACDILCNVGWIMLYVRNKETLNKVEKLT